METSKLKKFAQHARRSLIEQVSNKLKLVLVQDSAARRESSEAVEKLEKQYNEFNYFYNLANVNCGKVTL